MKKNTIIVILILVVLLIGILIFRLTQTHNENKLDYYSGMSNIVSSDLTYNSIQTNNTYEQVVEREISKVSAVIKEGTLSSKGVTLIITDDNTLPYINYAKSMFIYIKKNGKWEAVKPLDYFYSSNWLGYVPTYDRITEKVIDWTELYGELNKGEYLLLMTATPSDNGNNIFGVEFTIE